MLSPTVNELFWGALHVNPTPVPFILGPKPHDLFPDVSDTTLRDWWPPHVPTGVLVAAFFGLAGCAIQAFGSLFQVAPFVVLAGSPYLNVFKGEQLQALALLFLKLNTESTDIALVFFGAFNLLIGYLIFRSTFLPRILGVLMALSGLGG